MNVVRIDFHLNDSVPSIAAFLKRIGSLAESATRKAWTLDLTERLEGSPFVAANRTAEENANALAAAVAEALSRAASVEVSLQGVRGASSTFFNTLLAAIVASSGLEALRTRVKFACETTTQSIALARSMEVVAA